MLSPPCRLPNVSFWAYFCTLRIASAMTPADGPRWVCCGVSDAWAWAAFGESGSVTPFALSSGSCGGRFGRGGRGSVGPPSIRSGVFPRENGIVLVGFGARSTVARLAIDVGQLRTRRRRAARACRFSAATNTNRAFRVASAAAPAAPARAPAGARASQALHERQMRSDEDEDDDREVDDDRSAGRLRDASANAAASACPADNPRS